MQLSQFDELNEVAKDDEDDEGFEDRDAPIVGHDGGEAHEAPFVQVGDVSLEAAYLQFLVHFQNRNRNNAEN